MAPEIPGISNKRAVRAFTRAGFRISREGSRHTVMVKVTVGFIVIPRHNPIKAGTMGRIVKDAGLTPEEFAKLL